jgi:hypothetical protein
MSSLVRIFGVAAIIVCALTLYASLEQAGGRVMAAPPVPLDGIRHWLADSGLQQRVDVSIELNGRDVARGFSREGCDGLMLVAVLPHTAQGWAHMAPRLDLSAYQLRYFYDGARYPSVPRFERLAGQLWGDLRPHRTRLIPQVIAIAEAGQCGLARSAAGVLGAVSRGRLPPLGDSESLPGMGDVSA